MKIDLGPFRGMRPRTSKRFLADNEAQVALNCDLTAGSLKPRYAGLEAAELASAGLLQTIYLWGSGTAARWLQFAGDVDVVRGQVAGDATEKTYLTDGTLPLVVNSALVDPAAGNSEYPESSYTLGIPAPSAALTAAASGSGGSGDDRGIQYVFTYVRRWADNTEDEGPPSPVSVEAQAMDGETVNIANLGGAVSGRADITHKNIYRLNSGETGADFQFVKTVTVATTTTTDAVLDADLEEVLPSEGWIAPLTDMTGLIAHPGRFLVGFSGNRICASEVDQPHAWPSAYRWTVPFTPVGLGLFGQTVVILTTSYPYFLTGQTPDAMTLERAAAPAACLSKRGIVSTESGVMFPCPRGLYQIGPGGSGLATPAHFTKETFAAYHPETIHAAWHDGKYIGFYTSDTSGPAYVGGGFIFEPGEPGAELVGLNWYAHALHVDAETDTLYFLDYDAVTDTNRVKEWEANESTKQTYTWKSAERALPGKVSFGALRVDGDFPAALSAADQEALEAARLAAMAANEALFLAGPTYQLACIGASAIGMFAISGDNRAPVSDSYAATDSVNVRIYGENDTLRDEASVTSTAPVRLPGGFKDRFGYVEISGKVEVYGVDVATSVQELG